MPVNIGSGADDEQRRKKSHDEQGPLGFSRLARLNLFSDNELVIFLLVHLIDDFEGAVGVVEPRAVFNVEGGLVQSPGFSKFDDLGVTVYQIVNVGFEDGQIMPLARIVLEQIGDFPKGLGKDMKGRGISIQLRFLPRNNIAPARPLNVVQFTGQNIYFFQDLVGVINPVEGIDQLRGAAVGKPAHEGYQNDTANGNESDFLASRKIFKQYFNSLISRCRG